MRAVFFTSDWENIVSNLKADEFFNFDCKDNETLKLKLRDLASKGMKELFIFGNCEALDPSAGIKARIITDHINATGDNPLIGPNDDSAGPRFPDMTFAYSEKLTSELRNFLRSSGISFSESVLYGADAFPAEPDELDKLNSLNCTVRDKTTVWLDILARHAGIEVGAVVRTVG
ncbi:MAG: hypothetical protein JXN63_03355 [Candidatus Delongbacteria bacterium]|nr:hypothetical protein [Candidatus Delongbacteria bacterium]